MSKITEIYKSMMQETEDMQRQREALEKEIEAILLKEKKEMETDKYEIFREKFYQTAMLAEESGFKMGFRYAAQLMEECFR